MQLGNAALDAFLALLTAGVRNCTSLQPSSAHMPGISRRRFIQGVAAAGALSLPGWPLRRALAGAREPGLKGTDFQLEIAAMGSIRASHARQRPRDGSGPSPTSPGRAMTMDFPVAASVDLKAIKPGTRVNFSIEKGQGGMYE